MKVTHLPFDGEFKVTSAYGNRANPFSGKLEFHCGIDLVGKTNKNVYATCEGVVLFTGFEKNGFGNYVKIVEDANGLVHYFAHLESIAVKINQRVTYTTKLGVMGTTGNSTAPHTHYEIRRNGVHIDPAPYMRLPNIEGIYNAKNYLIELNPPVVVAPTPIQPQYKHKIGDLVTYSTAYREANGSKYVSLNPFQKQYISAVIPGARQPYKLKNGWFINDGDIRS